MKNLIVSPKHAYSWPGKRLFIRSAESVVTSAHGSRSLNRAMSAEATGDDTITLPSNLPGGTVPVFLGQGSKVEHPDLQVVFWGSYWPGSGAINQNALMDAFTKIVTGPYLSGLAQYGYAGNVNVRPALTDPMGIPPITVPLQALAPGVQQSQNVYNAVQGYVEALVNNDVIPNVDDNHDLIVMVVLDPNIPVPQNESASGAISTVGGSHGKLEIFELLDDNIRFAVGWITTQAGFDQATAIFSHELVEAITDPFPASGWVQTSPPASPNSNEIADVCNAPGRVDGVQVVSYWSIADQACIIPTERLSIDLKQEPQPPIPFDEPTQTVFHDFGAPLCASGYYDYHERTFQNSLTIRANPTGYSSPIFAWTLNGTAVPFGESLQTVPASWIQVLPPASKGAKKAGAPVPSRKPDTASVNCFVSGGTELRFSVGPNMGNTRFTIGVTVQESWDTGSPGGGKSTARVATTDVDLVNQEIVWGEAYLRDLAQCRHNHGLKNTPHGPIGPVNPGDPGPDLNPVLGALLDRSPERAVRLLEAADAVRSQNPRLAAALAFMAEHQ